MSKQFTHVIEIYPEKTERVMVAPGRAEDQIHPARYMLSRWDTGLIIGAAIGDTLNIIDFKNEKNMSTRYRDEKFAQAALRKFADEDAREVYNQPHAYIDEVDKSSKIERPSLVDIGTIGKSKQ